MGRTRTTPAAVALCLFLLLVAAGAPARAADVVGSVKIAAGESSVRRGGTTLPARPGLRLEAGDVLETGADGRLGVILRDDAVLSLGPSSRASLDHFQFAPAAGRLGFAVRLARGTLAYLSGVIARLAPESVRFETPVATAGIRGTRLAIRVAD